MQIQLTSLDDTDKFAKIAAKTLLEQKEKGAFLHTLYLLGEMGMGKTTFTRSFVGALPNAQEAEVASPSFTICHEYPTEPEVYHADLYRLPDNIDLPEELQNLGKNTLLIIEWAERLQNDAKAADRLEITFTKEKINPDKKNDLENIDNFVNLCELKRHVNLAAQGDTALVFLQLLTKNLQNCFYEK
jgi:tRNA threonylcarbamoyladenosine biosynthesis protein TsaE